MGNLERVHIQHYYSKNSGAVPQTEQLLEGEIALNIQDEKLYFKNAEGEVVSLSSGENIIEVTYAELYELRNKQELKPGSFYRIIDYVTTSNQQDTFSAGHQFDVVVLALSENTLSEDAWAMQHKGDTYFNTCNLSAWKLKYCLDNNTNRFAWATPIKYVSSGCYFPENVVNGNSFITPFKPVYTERIDDEYTDGEYNSFEEEDYFTTWGYNNNELCIYKSDLTITDEDDDYYGPDYPDEYAYRGKAEIDGVIYDKWQKFESDELPNGSDIMYFYTESMVIEEDFTMSGGKGVIYRMIDERGNDCPYDFKNILFGQGYNYTFSYERGQGDVIDASIFGNNGTLTDDGGDVRGVYSNVIRPYYNSKIQYLNHIIFVSDAIYDNGFYYGCYNNTFGDNCTYNTFGDNCYNNTFGNECNNNTFGNECYLNTFGYRCYHNTFGYHCDNNTFGNDCNNNTFGDSCPYNTLGDNCNNNTFGDTCHDNTFDYTCYNNTFGNDCYHNTFGNTCHDNTFGNVCTYNNFGNNCPRNTFGNKCYNNTFGDTCHDNTFGNNCDNNTFGDACYYNIFSNDCINSYFIRNCVANTLGYDCDCIHLGDHISDNLIGNNCNDITFDLSCENNVIGNNCSEIYFGLGISGNTIGNSCSIITFNEENFNNQIDDNCHNIDIYYLCYENKIGGGCYNVYIGESGEGEICRHIIGYNCGEIYLDGSDTSCNVIGNNCMDIYLYDDSEDNTIGNDCESITLKHAYDNTFGNNCMYIDCNYEYVTKFDDNSFGDNCRDIYFDMIPNEEPYEVLYNTFGNGCDAIRFYADSDINGNTFGNVCTAIELEGSPINCTFVNGLNGVTTGESRHCENMKVARNSNGELKIYNEADLIA